MTAQNGGPTGHDRAERPHLDRGQAMGVRDGRSARAHDVREGHPGRGARRREAHGSRLRGGCGRRAVQQIQRWPVGQQRRMREVEIARRGAEAAMAEQPLDGVDVHAGLQQMRGESVAQAVSPAT